MKKTKEKKGQDLSGVLVILCMAVIHVILGIVMLFVKQIALTTLCYIFSTILIILGIGLIVQYLMTESYKNINRYGFSIGALFVILGMCALVRAEKLAGYFIVGLGIWILASAIIKLQYALDLKALNDKTWGFLLLISAVIAVCAICVIINPFSEDAYLTYFTYIMLTVDGILSLISTAYLSLRIRHYGKQSEKQDMRKTEDNEKEPVEEFYQTEEPEQNKEENIEEGKEEDL